MYLVDGLRLQQLTRGPCDLSAPRITCCRSELAGQLVAPDDAGILRPCGALVLNDAPWLAKRVDAAKIHVAHSQVGPLALALGVASLSQAVEERLASPMADAAIDPAADLTRWVASVTSAAFRNGLRRLLYHEASQQATGSRSRATPGRASQSDGRETAETISSTLAVRLCELASLAVLPVVEIESRFIARHSGEDITTEPKGSLSLCSRGAEGNVIYVVTVSQPSSTHHACRLPRLTAAAHVFPMCLHWLTRGPGHRASQSSSS